MQLGSVYLYPNKIDAYTNLDAWQTERYRQVYQRNIKVYGGVDNRLEFQIKNSDQKPKSITGLFFVFSLTGFDTNELLMSRDCIVDSVSNGRIYVTITKSDILDLENGQYKYSLRYERRTADGEFYQVTDSGPLYTDSQYGSLGTLEVIGNVSGDVMASFEIREFSAYIEPWHDENYSISSLIDTNSQLVIEKTLHTLQFFFDSYTGRVIVQGSLDNGANPQNWVDIQTLDYIDVDREYTNFSGKYNWLRVKHIPNTPGLIGSFDVTQTLLFAYNVSINTAGRGYSVGNTILIKGNRLGGETPTNDLIITVQAVDIDGGIVGVTWSGASYNGTTTYTVGLSTEPNTGTFDKILYR
jgi:hypothetical protein